MRDEPVNPSVALTNLFRGSPPDEPERIYRRTREGKWLRRSRDAAFQRLRRKKVVHESLIPGARRLTA